MRLAERLAKEDMQENGVLFRVFAQAVRIGFVWTRLPILPEASCSRALMALAEIALKDDKEEEAVDALERIVNLYPENYLSEKAYFMLAKVYKDRVAGPAYDQGSHYKEGTKFFRRLSDPVRKPPTSKPA